MGDYPKVIDRRFRVLSSLGEGLSGEVYLVEAPEGRFALKLLKPLGEKGLEQEVISAFKFEFLLLKDIRHPNVVRVEEFGFDEELGRFYFTEEYLQGQPLPEFCKSKSPEVLTDLFIQAIRGLQAIHRSHILHGDLKGSNLLVTEEASGPVVKLIDFGLADPRFGLTAGTPSTMAPEKIMGDTVDERSDLYSLGITFYSLFTGENPFALKDYRLSYQAQLSLRPPLATQKNPRIPPFWNEIFDTLLAKNPANRYSSCEALLEAIDFARPQGLGEPAKIRPWSPERWVEREGPLEELEGKILKALKNGSSPVPDRQSQQAPPPVFLVIGEHGVGKSRILQEIRFRLQMEKWKVGFAEQAGEFSLWLVDDWMGRDAAQREAILERLAEHRGLPILLTTGLPEEAEAIAKYFRAIGREVATVHLAPFSRAELENSLKKITGLSEIPPSFMKGFWESTLGNPRQVVGLLEQFVKQRRLLDPHGAWHLAIFAEEGIDLSWFPLEIPQIDQALVTLPAAEHGKRAELWIQRSDELLQKNLFEEGEEALRNAAAEINQVADLSKKVHLRIQLCEKNGYRSIRLGQLEEARRCFDKALTLLEEVGIGDEVLAIRLHNFVGWLCCKEGKIEQGIQIFLEQKEKWERLPPHHQARVLNNELGFAYLLKGEWRNAISILEATLGFGGQDRSGTFQMKNLYNLAEAYLQTKCYAEAIERYYQAAEQARYHKNFEFLLRIYNGIGKAYHLQEKFKDGLAYYQRGLELARYLGDLASAAGIAQNIGSNLSERGEYKEAEAYLELAIKMLKKLPERNAETRYFYCRALLEMGDLYRKRKMFEEALRYVHEAHQLAFLVSSLQFFRFWVVYTQCQIEKDRGRSQTLERLSAELLALADDAEKEKKCREFLASSAGESGGEKSGRESATRADLFQPHH